MMVCFCADTLPNDGLEVIKYISMVFFPILDHVSSLRSDFILTQDFSSLMCLHILFSCFFVQYQFVNSHSFTSPSSNTGNSGYSSCAVSVKNRVKLPTTPSISKPMVI